MTTHTEDQREIAALREIIKERETEIAQLRSTIKGYIVGTNISLANINELKIQRYESHRRIAEQDAEITSLRKDVATLQADYASLQEERDYAQHEFAAAFTYRAGMELHRYTPWEVRHLVAKIVGQATEELAAENERLQAENERLRQVLDHIHFAANYLNVEDNHVEKTNT